MSARGNARWALGLALGLSALFDVSSAHAYCLTYGCNENTEDCEEDPVSGCMISGPRLYWSSSCVSFDVQQDGSALRGLDYESAQAAIHDGFSQWLNADCGDGQRPDVTIKDFGPVECRSAEYNQDAGNANVFMFRDDAWPYANAIDTLALTTLIFDADSGEIYDADVEVNTYESPMSIAPSGTSIGRSQIDFRSVITHEIGHFLGLSHSSVPGSTMRPSYAPGNIQMASIEADDVAGICTALAPGRSTSSNSCEPRHGFSSECAIADSGCSIAAVRARGSSWPWLLAGFSSLLLWRLRRADRRRAAGPGPRSGPGSAS